MPLTALSVLPLPRHVRRRSARQPGGGLCAVEDPVILHKAAARYVCIRKWVYDIYDIYLPCLALNLPLLGS